MSSSAGYEQELSKLLRLCASIKSAPLSPTRTGRCSPSNVTQMFIELGFIVLPIVLWWMKIYISLCVNATHLGGNDDSLETRVLCWQFNNKIHRKHICIDASQLQNWGTSSTDARLGRGFFFCRCSNAKFLKVPLHWNWQKRKLSSKSNKYGSTWLAFCCRCLNLTAPDVRTDTGVKLWAFNQLVQKLIFPPTEMAGINKPLAEALPTCFWTPSGGKQSKRLTGSVFFLFRRNGTEPHNIRHVLA